MWHRLSMVFAAALFFAACSDDTVPYEKEPPANGDTGGDTGDEDRIEPTAGIARDGKSTGIFPSDLHTVASEDTYTGRKVQLRLADDDPLFRETVTSGFTLPFLNELDGFGTSAGGWIRFSEYIEKDSVVAEENALFGYIDADDAVLVPSEVHVDRDQIAFRPDFPLPPMVTGFFASTQGIKDRDGTEFKANDTLQSILDGSYDPADGDIDEELAERMNDVAQKLVDAGHIERKEDLTALSVFTTQSIHQTTMEIAEEIRNFEPEINIDSEPCEVIEQDNLRRCYIHITVRNFISDDNTIADDAADAEEKTYELLTTIHLPLEDAEERAENAEGVDRFIPYDPEVGYPVAIFGHGLTGNGNQAKDIAKYIAPMGIATIGVDAPQHGTHPTKSHPDEKDLDLLQELFGIAIQGSKADLNPFQLRDGWRQSNLDKLGLIEAIKKGIDLDGDGFADLDADRISYLGASLGSIQGTEFVATTPDLELALLAIGGARISDFLRYPGMIQLVGKLIAPRVKDDGLLRFLILLQTAVEKGDGVNWGPYVLQNRFPSAGDPMHVAMQLSIPDEIVPKETGMMQARTIGAPIIGTAQLPDPHLDVLEADTPVSENHPSGKTAGLLQVHWIHKMNNLDEWRETSHASSPDSLESLTYWKHIFHTMYYDDSRIPELIDPYKVLGEEPPSVFEP